MRVIFQSSKSDKVLSECKYDNLAQLGHHFIHFVNDNLQANLDAEFLNFRVKVVREVVPGELAFDFSNPKNIDL